MAATVATLETKITSDILVEADSAEVVYKEITRCFTQSTLKYRTLLVAKLLKANPAAAQHKDENGHNLAHELCMNSEDFSASEYITILKRILARHEDALKEAENNYGNLPVHYAAMNCPVYVLKFMLKKYPEAATLVPRNSNMLHFAVHGCGEDQAAKARLLCTQYPAMMLQRDHQGRTPLLLSCTEGAGDDRDATILLLCEAGGREAASTAILHPKISCDYYDGQLPLHWLIELNAGALRTKPLGEVADAFRLLLRLYPEAAGTEGGKEREKTTPYHLSIEKGLPRYYRRLLLRAAPHLNPAELRKLNWAARRLAMYVVTAVAAKTPTSVFANKDLVRHIVSFL